MEGKIASKVSFSGGNASQSLSTRRAMLSLMWLARVFAAGIIVQVFLAGLALFVDSANLAAHSSFPRYFAFLPILMLLKSDTCQLSILLLQ